MLKAGDSGSVSIDVAAPPGAVYDLVSDITRMGEWSPETTKAVWLDGATGPAVGAKFKGTNKRGIVRWSTSPKVTAATPGEEFAFVTTFAGREATRWTYRFEPSGDGGTTVTESWEMVVDMIKPIDLLERYVMRVKDRRADLEAGMRATLERIKAAAERA